MHPNPLDEAPERQEEEEEEEEEIIKTENNASTERSCLQLMKGTRGTNG